MEGLIPVVNKLQDVFNTIGTRKVALDLPQIVVIGSQSSGKSSVLENIVGRGFLPRGSGICTRRPLVLQLYHSDGKEEYAEFLHVPNKKFTDFDEVRREIETETERETGKNKGVSNKAIRLKVFSPNVLNLTLVDLPGITKVPVGDQPGNIEELIRNMCLEYISNPLSIILAVSPANADLANSDALKMAREVDPMGDRTIGILTKLDLVDEGVDVLDALDGKVIPLKKGYIGIVNRSQAEINANSPLSDLRRKERAFFLNHPSYRSVASKQGTEYLTKSLNGILLAHIREHLPDLKSNVQRQLRDVDKELAALGSEPVDFKDKTSQGQLILGLLSKYSTYFVDSIDGRARGGADPGRAARSEDGLCGGARLARAFKYFSERLLLVSPLQGLSDGDIGTAILNATGPRPSLFVPELSFEILVKRQLTHLREPALSCVTEVFEVLQEVADQACFPGLARFSTLQERVLDVVQGMLGDNLGPTQEMIENLIRIEQAFINTSHPDFSSKLSLIRNMPYTSSEQMLDVLVEPRPSDSASSVASLSSEPMRARHKPRSKTYSLDLDGVPGIDADAATADSAAALAGDEEVVEEENTEENGRKSNFMSFIFNERTNNGTTSSAPGGARGIRQNSLSSSRMVSSFAQKATLLQSEGMAADTTEAEKDAQVRIIKRLIDTYLSISRSTIRDLTPKTVMFFLVNHVKESVHTELIRELYKEELFDDLLREDDQVALTRGNLKETSKLLHRALTILTEVREYKLA
ncbi:Dynamin [Hondaea fermentalgiana]|uniref:Dynamin n=1 Tax=Hondaea fermentalgiana TaxID=2315210 RepID=A0A2R5G0T2_9STRA|nr:Dynamin [Hondaea fermentalgiana]|eukprot:GBG24626.1 Dynamin [Hondaea fermentalgiana]